MRHVSNDAKCHLRSTARRGGFRALTITIPLAARITGRYFRCVAMPGVIGRPENSRRISNIWRHRWISRR